MENQAIQMIRSAAEGRPEIVFAFVFGSQVSGTANVMSDIDLAIYTKTPVSPENRFRIQADLARECGTPKLDLVDLRLASPLLAFEAVTSGIVILSRNEDILNDFERKTMARYLDTQRLRDVQNQYLRAHLKVS
jgi:predicted nucleotidyltransferase